MDKAADLFRKNVADRMRAAGVTQRGLAEEMGVSQPMVQQYLGGKNKPGLDVLERFAEALKTSPWELIKPPSASSLPSLPPPLLPILLEIATLLPSMNKGEVDVLLETARAFAGPRDPRNGDAPKVSEKTKKAR